MASGYASAIKSHRRTFLANTPSATPGHHRSSSKRSTWILATFAVITVIAPTCLFETAQAAADPQPGPLPVPQRPGVVQPNDPPRLAPIGGARVSSSTPQGEGPGNGAPLAASRERSVAALPPVVTDGIHAATTWPGKSVVIHLPNERELSAANWGEGGAAAYGSGPVDYVAIPDAGGGIDIRMVRKSFISPSDFTLGIRTPDGTHLRQAGRAVVVETDASPGSPAAIIGAVSVPEARDANGSTISVTPSLGGGYVYQQTNLTLDIGSVDLLAFPVTITVSYHATTTVPPTAQGDPGPKPPVNATPGNADRCVSGPSEFHGSDNPNSTADFTLSCGRLVTCMKAVPARTSALTCENAFMSDLSGACVSAFGQDGPDYESCLTSANGHTRWAKENMLPGGATPTARN